MPKTLAVINPDNHYPHQIKRLENEKWEVKKLFLLNRMKNETTVRDLIVILHTRKKVERLKITQVREESSMEKAFRFP